jgi:hypothetical protein
LWSRVLRVSSREVHRSCPKELDVIARDTDETVAPRTEEPTNMTGPVVVVDGESSTEWFGATADRTHSFLEIKELSIVGG